MKVDGTQSGSAATVTATGIGSIALLGSLFISTPMKTCTEKQWISVAQELPPEGVAVWTKIDDAQGCRNEAQLKRKGNLWFFTDMSMYVYYRPTHWSHA
jgi:hypothetical protein